MRALAPQYLLLLPCLVWFWWQGRRRAAIAGEPLRFVSNSPGESAQVIGPDGRSVRSTMRNGIVTVVDTSTAGLYRFQGRTVAVNPAAGPESDLRAVAARASFDAGASQTADPRPLDLTPALVAAALLLLGIEWHYRTA